MATLLGSYRIATVPERNSSRLTSFKSTCFTPTSGSWLNLVEIFFGIITRQAIRRGSFDSVRELIDAIGRFIDGWNERCQPFIWTKDADTIIAKAHRKSTSGTRH